MIEKGKAHLGAQMDTDPPPHSDQYLRILSDIKDMVDRHNCEDCNKKMEQIELPPVEIDDWNDYVQEVKNLRKIIEDNPFCISVTDCFPKGNLYEYRGEYEDRIADIQSTIRDATDFFFAMEYYESSKGEFKILEASDGQALPGVAELAEI